MAVNKSKQIREMNNYMLNKTLRMFDYKGLPEEIPVKEMEKILQKNGYAFYTEIDGTPYVLWGSLGGQEDAYGRPTKINVNNPALGLSEEYTIGEDGVLMRSDSLTMGLKPLFDRYNELLVENQITMTMNTFHARAILMLSASDDKTRESAENFLKRLEGGEFSVIGENAMFEGITSHSMGSSSSTKITDLIEYHQYIKATFYNEIGLSQNGNMKRERLTSGEVEQQEDGLLTLVEDMLRSRKESLAEIENMFGKRINVELSDIWKSKDEGRLINVNDN